jgi:hypothetical protein
MAILLVDHKGQHRAAILPARVLIGRRSMNNLVIEDPAISRMHAWIDRQGNASYLTDMRSRTGTRINGRPATQQQRLHDGDIIEIGPVRLRFFESDVIPGGIDWFEIPAEGTPTERDPGIRFDCPHCQSPMWASLQFAGHKGECTYCGEPFVVPAVGEHARSLNAMVPSAAPVTAAVSGNGHSHAATALAGRTGAEDFVGRRDWSRRPATTPAVEKEPARAHKCGVCQSNILPLEASTTCPSCGLHFHEECWQENYGCSAYGCSQVNVLKPPEVEAREQAAADAEAAAAIADDEPPPRTPWEFILLGVSAIAVIISAVSFGGASLLTFLASVGLFFRTRADSRRKSGALFGAIALSVVGMATGAGVSYFLFVYGRK